MSLMGSLYLGLSGLQMGQNALNTTAHNMANVDTVGYTRQQVQQGTRIYNTISQNASANAYQQLGLGVNYSQVKQVRDYFLDKAYRKEVGRGAFYDTFTSAVEEVENLFQELDGEAFATSIENLWTSVQELAKYPDHAVNQSLFVQRCNEFLTRGQAVYQGLCEYQDDLNYKIKQQVDTMNAYGRRIAELNIEIAKIEGGQIEKANDLKDERNQLIDELAAMGQIECRTDASGNTLISLEGKDFVKADSAHVIGLKYDEVTGFCTPYWTQLAKTKTVNGVKVVDDIERAKLFNMSREISPDTDTDIGSLKAMLYARGDRRATYEDLKDADAYNKEISQSVVMNVQAEFDHLIHGIVTGINKIFKDAAETATAAADAAGLTSDYMRDADGFAYTIFNTKASDILTSADIPAGGYFTYDGIKIEAGGAAGELLVTLPDGATKTIEADGLDDVPVTLDDGTQISSDGAGGFKIKVSHFTLENLIINGEIKQAPTLLGFKKDDDKIDQETADALKDLFMKEEYTLNPNVKTKTNFINFYDDMISMVANDGSVLRGISENQQITVDNTYAAREQILGVCSDEEMSNMVMFQNAYNAASRYINVVSEMLEHIINTMAR